MLLIVVAAAVVVAVVVAAVMIGIWHLVPGKIPRQQQNNQIR